MTPEEKYDLFDRYCTQQLTINDQKRLDKLVKEDTAFAKEFRLYQDLHLHIEVSSTSEKEQKALENNLKHIGDNFFSKRKEEVKQSHKDITKQPKVIRIPRWTYAIAASVAIIIGVYFLTPSDPVYKDFVDIPELSLTERSGGEVYTKKAEEAFNERKYDVAADNLFALLQKDINNSEYQFYYGISLLELNRYPEAKNVFQKLYQGDSLFKYKALWFEALAELKQKKYSRCRTLLKKLPKTAEDYQNAQKLLDKL